MSCGEVEEPGQAAAQLAAEVAWCLEVIEDRLEKEKGGEKKVKELRKARRLLRAEETPLIQKRQLMRTSCGDYRAKMKAEEELVKLDAAKVKFNVVDQKTSKSNFFKKAADKSSEGPEKPVFRFNFSLPAATS